MFCVCVDIVIHVAYILHIWMIGFLGNKTFRHRRHHKYTMVASQSVHDQRCVCLLMTNRANAIKQCDMRPKIGKGKINNQLYVLDCFCLFGVEPVRNVCVCVCVMLHFHRIYLTKVISIFEIFQFICVA